MATPSPLFHLEITGSESSPVWGHTILQEVFKCAKLLFTWHSRSDDHPPPRTIWNISSLCHVQAGPVTLFFLFSATALLFVGGVTLDVGHCSIASSEGIMFDLFWPKTVWSRKNINCHHSTVLLLPLEMKKFHPNLSTSANLSSAAVQRRSDVSLSCHLLFLKGPTLHHTMYFRLFY